MANYQESAVSGTQWKRACRVVIENPQAGNPSVLIVEETATQLGDKVFTQPDANLSASFVPGTTFPLLNPETGEQLGKDATHEEVYVLLYSLYMDLAAKRDALPVVSTDELAI